jgi:hypothetical protein
MFLEGSDAEEDLEAAPARSDGYQALAIDAASLPPFPNC